MSVPIGLVELRSDGERLAFAAPPSKQSPLSPEELLSFARALGIAASDVELSARLDNGTTWVALLLRDADSVLRIEPDHSALRALPKVGVVGPYGTGAECQLELRAFATSQGVPEDPVTGSLNAAVAQWLLSEQRVPERYIAAQGARLSRAGRVHVAREGEKTLT
jgi:PhzF family phenazine biosynthesis protein